MARERWGSKLGVILAVAGSAIGLGNFLRFPGLAAQHGGAFMIPYLIALLLLGIPLMWIEWTIGRFGGGLEHSTAPGMFHTMWRKNRFIKYFGVIGIFGPIVIFIYYTYIESWLLGYCWFSIRGAYNHLANQDALKGFLNDYRVFGGHRFGFAYVMFTVTFALNIVVVYCGIKGGIEAVCKWALPVLFLLALVLVVRVFTLGTPDLNHPGWSVAAGLDYMWTPKWEALKDPKVWFDAAGQICFTLSVGIGVILTYASYLTKKDDVALSGLTAASTNEVAEVILGGSIVIPAAFAFFGPAGVQDAAARVAGGSSFDLSVITMPMVLQRIPFAAVFGCFWYVLLFLAGLTSSISLAQPAVAFLEDEFNLSKKKAVVVFAITTFVLCQAPIFFLAHGVLDELDFWGGTFCLLFFGLIEVILFAWVFGVENAWTELHVGSDIAIPKFYRFIIKYVTPTFLLFILGFWFYEKWGPVICMKGYGTQDVPYVLGTRIGLVLFFAVLAVMVWIAWRRRASQELKPCE
jgi:SNF family Na+-dependent transporter